MAHRRLHHRPSKPRPVRPSDAYLVGLDPEALARAPDVPLPGGQTLSWLVNNLLVQHAALHGGEIAALRGLQGLQGLP